MKTQYLIPSAGGSGSGGSGSSNGARLDTLSTGIIDNPGFLAYDYAFPNGSGIVNSVTSRITSGTGTYILAKNGTTIATLTITTTKTTVAFPAQSYVTADEFTLTPQTGATGVNLQSTLAIVAGGTLVTAGTASTTSSGNTIASVVVTSATGGTTPYSYQWYRSTTSGFTPGGGSLVAGATSQTLNDTGLTNGTTYYYKNIVTDNFGTTSTSNQTTASPSAGTSTNALQFNSANNSQYLGVI